VVEIYFQNQQTKISLQNMELLYRIMETVGLSGQKA